jgi:hypothetical protein
MSRRVNAARRALGVGTKVLGALALFALAIDGALSVAWGMRWLEVQRVNTPRWYARIPAALQRLPDPAFRLLGGLQTVGSALGLLRLK